MATTVTLIGPRLASSNRVMGRPGQDANPVRITIR